MRPLPTIGVTSTKGCSKNRDPILNASSCTRDAFLSDLGLENGGMAFSHGYSSDVFPPLFVSKFRGPLYRIVAQVRTSLDEEAFSAAWEQGRAMPIEQAIEYAQQEGHRESKERAAE